MPYAGTNFLRQMCKEKDKFKNEPQSWEHVFYIRNTNTIAIKNRKKRIATLVFFVKIQQNWLKYILFYYFVYSFITFFRISWLFIDFPYKLLNFNNSGLAAVQFVFFV